ncbi:dTDP-4-dehydrorhamnose 3,5-epimerase [Deltaproteobacteria bacterium Smac51]|nr:dTDP-4-dehydrorhamnose 3,5-epimerase [Deltaproteobacteria bacterium Smac51]
MKYHKTQIEGVTIIDLEPFEDHRGYFARAFCQADFHENGLDFQPVQANLSGNLKRGTLRGLHYQAAPHQEDKLVRAVRGAVFDVAVDLRPQSATYRQWFGTELSAENRRSLLIPKGCAHGYLTLTDDAETLYMVSQAYHPESDRGLRWNDPFCNVQWPFDPLVISDKDRQWPDYKPESQK